MPVTKITFLFDIMISSLFHLIYETILQNRNRQVNDKRSQGVDNSRHIKLFKNLLVFHCHYCYNKLYF